MSKLFSLKAVLLSVAILLSAGCAGRNAAPNPLSALPALPVEGSAEVVFARAMSAHHNQAVEMSLNVRDRSSDAELRIVALDIILTQQNQIGQMTGWLSVWGLPFSAPPANSATPDMAGMNHGSGNMPMMGMATQKDVNALQTLPVADAENSFLTLMIVHHEGGVKMAQDVLAKTSRAEVLQLANAIVRSQQSEIETLKQMLARRK
jgi:uncharacterized protein (DUF305 family)